MAIKILVVEDDDNIRSVISENLREEGYIVLEFDNGREALNIIENIVDIDVYVFDIMLPGQSGLELLKAVRLENQSPVLMLTALDDDDTQMMSFDLLADDYVTKPFSPNLLVKRVKSLLRRIDKSDASLVVGELELNMRSHELYEGGNVIDLTFKEFEIMRILLMNNGCVLTREQILNLIWEYNYFGDEKIVNVHIKNIRKKLKKDPITTVLGVGYKIENK